jgi:hypothetical protein
MARPRLRSTFRAVGLGLAVLVVLGLAASLALRLYGRERLARAQARFEALGFSLDLKSYELPPIPREQNAGAWLEAGAAGIVWGADDEKVMFSSVAEPVETWDDKRTEKIRTIVAMNRGALETLRRADALPSASFEIPYREGDRARLPDIMALRRASTLVLTAGRLAVRDHDQESAVQSMAGLSRLADALTEEPTLVAQALGYAVDAHLVTLGGDMAIALTPWHVESARATVSAAVSVRDRLERLRRALAFESAAVWSWLEGDGLSGDPSADADASRARSIFRLTGLLNLTRASALEASLGEAALLDAPLPALLMERPLPSSSPFLVHRWMAEPLIRSARRAILVARLTLARRQLVHAALVIRALGVAAHRYPTERPSDAELDQPNALTRVPLSYSTSGDGSARVAIPRVPSDLSRFAPWFEINLRAVERARPLGAR